MSHPVKRFRYKKIENFKLPNGPDGHKEAAEAYFVEGAPTDRIQVVIHRNGYKGEESPLKSTSSWRVCEFSTGAPLPMPSSSEHNLSTQRGMILASLERLSDYSDTELTDAIKKYKQVNTFDTVSFVPTKKSAPKDAESVKEVKPVKEAKSIKFTNGREYPVSSIEKVSNVVMRETGSGSKHKREYIVYAHITGSGEMEACVTKMRGEADVFMQTWREVLKGRASEIAPTPPAPDATPSTDPALTLQSPHLPDAPIATPTPVAATPVVTLDPTPIVDNRKRAMRASFAQAKQLFPAKDINEEMFWCYIRHQYKVESRRNLSEMQLCLIEAKLRACQESKVIFAALLADIQNAQPKDDVKGAAAHGLGDPATIRLFKVVQTTQLKRGAWTDQCPVYQLLEQAHTISEQAIEKIENYADTHKTDMLIVYPNGATREVKATDPEHRQSLRENPPVFRETWCKRCSTTPDNCQCGRFV